MPGLKRAAALVALLQICYLIVFNLALNLPLTQDLINKIKPEKFTVNWDSAWTAYPFRVHATGVNANGQARSQQWQIKTPKASATISLFPLIYKTVSLYDVEAMDVSYFQRPRPRPDKDYATTREYFPSIQGRELELKPPHLEAIKKGKKGWKINIGNMLARGEHSLWLYQAQAVINGNAKADLSVLTRGGPISISNGDVDLTLESVTINDNRKVIENGYVKGRVEILPFVVKQNKGIKALSFVELDVELNALAERLDFLNVYLEAFEGMKLDGAGNIQGRVVFSQGKLLPHSIFEVSAHALELSLLDYRIQGDGSIHVDVPTADTANPDVHFAIAFDKLNAYYAGDSLPLLTGNGLVFDGIGTNNIIPLGGNRPHAQSLALTISSLKVPDLAAFQRFLPTKWAFKLHGGEGKLRGQVSVDQSSFTSNFNLDSDAADVGINDFRFSSNLDMGLNVNSPSLESGLIDISGTHLKINKTRVSNDKEQSKLWHASIEVEKGIVQLNLDEAGPGVTGANHMVDALQTQEIGALLAAADEELKINASISDLGWLNVLLNNPYDMAINGNGEISSNVVIKSGWLETGTELAISPQDMSLEVLDYIANGNGELSLKVIKGGEFPDMTLAASIKQAKFKRKREDQEFVEDITILLNAEARAVTPGAEHQDMSLRLQIPSAKIIDMSIYNQYLPEDSPLLITGGEAALDVDIQLETNDAGGYVRLNTEKISARVDDQDITAELSAEIKLAGGQPRDMKFDISGSTIKLDAVKVIGEAATFREEDWATKISFNKAETLWKKPIQLDIKADIEMTDSIPIVSMIANQKGKETWLTKALIIDDVKGNIDLQMADNQIVIPYAFVASDNIDVGAKAIINHKSRNGMIYVRYKALKGLLKINNGKRNLDVLKVKEKFDTYSTDEVIVEKGLPN